MSDYCISPEMSYQFIMSPFMSKVMAAADFIQTDVTYGENKFLPYLFNATGIAALLSHLLQLWCQS